MKARFIKSYEKNEILKEIEDIYGFDELPYLLIETGKKRIRGFSGNLSKQEIALIGKICNIEIIGMYLLSAKDDDLRINFDAISLFRKKIKKRIIEISEEQFEKWIRGQDLEIKCERGITVLKFKDELVGLGKSNGEKIFNYIPKERKIKKSKILF